MKKIIMLAIAVMAAVIVPLSLSAGNQGKILVAYFSWGGNTEAVAEYIAAETHADLFRIEPVTPYPTDYKPCAEVALKERDTDARPAIKNKVDNWADYDTVFIGCPVWWHTAPMIIDTFADSYDFSGKTVVPFCTYASTYRDETLAKIVEITPKATHLEGFGARNRSIEGITDWLRRISMIKSSPRQVLTDTVIGNQPYVLLNNGLEMPRFGIGTFNVPGDSVMADAICFALKNGYRHIDTAHAYAIERGVGQGIRESGVPREEIWLTSKIWPTEYGEGKTLEGIDKMLDRLGVDYIDLLYVHQPVGDWRGAWRDMEKSVELGKVRSLGISNFDAADTLFTAVNEWARIKPAVLQIELHPYAQREQWQAKARQHEIQMECWFPLGGAMSNGALFRDPVLIEIAKVHGKTPAQIILRWHIQKGFSVIPGATDHGYITENIDIFDFELTPEEMAKIHALDKEKRFFNMSLEDKQRILIHAEIPD